MRLLLDTHVLAWWVFDDRRLSAVVRRLIADTESVSVSAVSAYEIARKYSLGKWPEAKPLVDGFKSITEAESFSTVDIAHAHATHAGLLPGEHRDPFDRLIVAQAAVEGMRIVSADDGLRLLGADPLWRR